MIEPEISLAFSVQSKHGAYALLLGSGVSRAAGIPTGWGIVLDLIKKLAAAQQKDCGVNPEDWYIEEYKIEPDYTKILEDLGKSPTIRNQILRSYFEPNKKELEQGKKMPTLAHKSIANLVNEGYIKVILTTNFDRLLELALQDIGITPTVISTPDAIKGAYPIQHLECVIIKLHGDYLDTRIKNSPVELKSYDKAKIKLLDRIIDEYGLIICGWSADWDIALREALERCTNHRFQTYWTYIGKLGVKANDLIKVRRAEKIKILGADSFFAELEQKVMAIQEFNEPHPLSAKTAVTTLKSLLRDKNKDIQLNDMVMDIVDDTYKKLSPHNFPLQESEMSDTEDNFIKRVKNYDSYVDTLLNVIIAGCHWGKKDHIDLWVKCLQRISNPLGGNAGLVKWLNMRLYPALLLLYGSGLSCVISDNFDTFESIIKKPRVRGTTQEEILLDHLMITRPIDNEEAKKLISKNSIVALNEYLFNRIREPFRKYLPSDIEYQKSFDKFEYLLSLIFEDNFAKKPTSNVNGPTLYGIPGIFAFRSTYQEGGNIINAHISSELIQEQINFGKEWPPLKSGLFDSSVERFTKIKAAYDGYIVETYKQYHPVL